MLQLKSCVFTLKSRFIARGPAHNSSYKAVIKFIGDNSLMVERTAVLSFIIIELIFSHQCSTSERQCSVTIKNPVPAAPDAERRTAPPGPIIAPCTGDSYSGLLPLAGVGNLLGQAPPGLVVAVSANRLHEARGDALQPGMMPHFTPAHSIANNPLCLEHLSKLNTCLPDQQNEAAPAACDPSCAPAHFVTPCPPVPS